MIAFLIYPLVTTALYYLGAWALVTRWLWSRYPPVLGAFMVCAACSGFWYGLGAAWLLPYAGVTFPGGRWAPLLSGLCALVWTPVIGKRLLFDLQGLHPADDAPTNPQA